MFKLAFLKFRRSPSLSHIKQYLFQQLKIYLCKQVSPPPIILFFLLVYSYLDEVLINLPFYLLASLVAFIYQLNILFLLPYFLYAPNSVISILSFILSALSSNTKWKALLFIYTTTNSYFHQADYFSKVLFLASLFLTLTIYRNLIFDTISDNKQYFSGIFALMALHGFRSVGEILNIRLHIVAQVILFFWCISLGHSIICLRFEELRDRELSSIKKPRQVAHFVSLMNQGLQNQYIAKAKLGIHRRECQKLTCFCKQQQYSESTTYFLRQIYEDLIRQFGNASDPILKELYIDQLIHNQQIAIALYYISTWKTQGFFQAVAQLRSEAKVKSFLNDQNSSNSYELEYVYALEYDHHCLHVITQIYAIIKLKLKFWREVIKKAPLLKKLQKEGSEIVTRMYELNYFYAQYVKPQEEKLFSFDATVLYAMYLISTTSFKDYAKVIIKNTAKLMQEVSIHQNDSSETFAIRTVVKDSLKGYIKDQAKYFTSQRQRQTKQLIGEQYQTNFRLVIDRVSSGFCRLIRMDKRELMGKQLNYVIPDGYKEVHNIRLSYLLDFEAQRVTEIILSKVLHQELVLPIKGLDKELFTGYVCIKFHVDVQQGLTFVSVIKTIPQKTVSALLDFQGNITQKQKGFPAEIIKHSEVISYLDNLKQTWKRDKIIKEETFTIMVNSTSLGVKISSPLLGLFLQKQNLRQSSPPIHIDITNEESNKRFNMTAQLENKVGQELKKMEKILMNYDQESSTSSSKGINSAVNIITSFSQNSTVPVYNYIAITFIIVILLCTAVNVSFYLVPSLGWDNSVKQKNPIYDSLNLYRVMLTNIQSELNLQNGIRYQKYKDYLNLTELGSYMLHNTYEQQLIAKFQIFQAQLKLKLQQTFGHPSELLQYIIESIYKTKIPIPNIESLYRTAVYEQPTIYLTYNQIQKIYITDYSLVKNNSPLMLTVVGYINYYIRSVVNTTNFQVTSHVIDSSIRKSQKFQTIFGAICGVCLLLLLVPMGIVLRKRFETHERVYDLLVSVDSQQAVKEIKSLGYIANILNNYSQSHQILKGNVLDYQENVLKPKKDTGRRRSAQNELIIGLEKYDVSQNQEDKLLMTERKELVPKEIDPSPEKTGASVFSMIKGELGDAYSGQFQLKKRKRSGELDVSKSEYDPSAKVCPKHCIFYSYNILFICLLLTGSIINISYGSSVKQQKDAMVDLFTQFTIRQDNVARLKVFLWGGSEYYAQRYNISTSVTAEISALTEYMYLSEQYTGKEANVLSSCRSITYKICDYEWSLRLLQGQFAYLAKDLVELRTIKEGANLTSIPNLIELYQKMFYFQELNNKIYDLTIKMSEQMMAKMMSDAKEQSNKRRIVLLSALVLCIFGAIVGVIVICGMKEQYLREVYMLTFLNDFMIIKNKRVESYLESLSKNTNV